VKERVTRSSSSCWGSSPDAIAAQADLSPDPQHEFMWPSTMALVAASVAFAA
jgi:hypothetical protein